MNNTLMISDNDNYYLRIVLSNWLTDTKQMHCTDEERTPEGQAVYNLWEML